MPYTNAKICLNGHVVSLDSKNEDTFCSRCGAETFSVCQNCGAPIRGYYYVEDIIMFEPTDYKKPYYCYKCGAPYPWTQKILDNAVELLSLDDELDSSSKELIKSAIPDLIVDTPTTPIAIAKYHKGIANAGQIIKGSLRQLLIDVISETAKKTLFP